MRSVVLSSALLLFAVPSSQASGHAHSAITVHAHTLAPAVTIHTHAPNIFPTATLTQNSVTNTPTTRGNSFAGFLVRTMLGFSTHIGR